MGGYGANGRLRREWAVGVTGAWRLSRRLSRQFPAAPGGSRRLRLAPVGSRQRRGSAGAPGLEPGARSSGRMGSMTAQILDGKATAAAIKSDLTARVAALKEKGVTPGLGTVLVGDDPGSQKYVAGKHRDCAQVGIASIQRELPATATQEEIEAVVRELNEDPSLHRLHRPAAASQGHRREPRPRTDGPGQGRGRPAPDEPRPPRPERARPAALHPERRPHPAPPVRRRDQGRRGRGRRPGHHHRPPDAAAADAAQ